MEVEKWVCALGVAPLNRPSHLQVNHFQPFSTTLIERPPYIYSISSFLQLSSQQLDRQSTYLLEQDFLTSQRVLLVYYKCMDGDGRKRGIECFQNRHL